MLILHVCVSVHAAHAVDLVPVDLQVIASADAGGAIESLTGEENDGAFGPMRSVDGAGREIILKVLRHSFVEMPSLDALASLQASHGLLEDVVDCFAVAPGVVVTRDRALRSIRARVAHDVQRMRRVQKRSLGSS